MMLGRTRRLFVAILFPMVPLAAGGANAQSLPPDIAVTKVINAPLAEVWKAWTTAEGIESFFAVKAAKVEPVPGGAFELWFGVNNPEGSRGSEG
ncbi:MAG: SRPBCC domain-containing protein, partial [Betaproteobacteria bacterium]